MLSRVSVNLQEMLTVYAYKLQFMLINYRLCLQIMPRVDNSVVPALKAKLIGQHLFKEVQSVN